MANEQNGNQREGRTTGRIVNRNKGKWAHSQIIEQNRKMDKLENGQNANYVQSGKRKKYCNWMDWSKPVR